MLTPTYRYEGWSRGTRKIVVDTGLCTEITFRKSKSNGEVYTDFGGFHMAALTDLTSLGFGQGEQGQADVLEVLVSHSQDEREYSYSQLFLNVEAAFAQAGGEPDPTVLQFDVFVDGVSILSAPATVPLPSTNFKQALPLLVTPTRVPALTMVALKYRMPWSGNVEIDELPPYFTNVSITAE